MSPRWAAKVDENQEEIVAALRRVGASVECLHRVGRNVPDLLVGYRGYNYLLEVKMPKEKATDEQLDWHRAWRGTAPKVVKSIEEAFAAIGVGVAR